MENKCEEKEKEREIVLRFQEAYPEFPAGIIHAFESPDFIVNNKTKKIGIEVTRIYKDHNHGKLSAQAQLGQHEKVLTRAKEIFEQKIKAKFTVFVSFEERSTITKVDPLALFIVDKITEKLGNGLPQGERPIQIYGGSLSPHQDQISLILIYAHDYRYEHYWKTNSVFSILPINIRSVQKGIIKKEKKWEKFRQCDEHRLLLAIQFWDAGMEQEIPRDFNFAVPKSNYDRIILFKTAENFIHRVF